MLSDYLLLQITIAVTVFFIYWVSDIFNSILVGVVYLLLLSLYSFYNDSDVFVGFLLVIDLGVFFIMFAFILHLTKFLVNKNSYNLEYKNLYYMVFLVLVLALFLYVMNFSNDFNYNKTIENVWFFYVSHYNYYNISHAFFNSEMQLLKEAYFNFNNFEFFLISIGIYFGVVTTYLLFNFLNKLYIKNNALHLMKGLHNKADSTYFFRYQDMIQQSNTRPNTRVWFRDKK